MIIQAMSLVGARAFGGDAEVRRDEPVSGEVWRVRVEGWTVGGSPLVSVARRPTIPYHPLVQRQIGPGWSDRGCSSAG
jgi:hypothetical protein